MLSTENEKLTDLRIGRRLSDPRLPELLPVCTEGNLFIKVERPPVRCAGEWNISVVPGVIAVGMVDRCLLRERYGKGVRRILHTNAIRARIFRLSSTPACQARLRGLLYGYSKQVSVLDRFLALPVCLLPT